jgi:hypothetical protein
MSFSERHGYIAASKIIQVDGMNDALRASIWNVFDDHLFSSENFTSSSRGHHAEILDLSRKMWRDYFKRPSDTRPEYGFRILEAIRVYFFKCPWFQVYDFVEFMISQYRKLVDPLNRMLERELSGYRIIDGIVAPVSTTEELATIETAITDENVPGGTRAHLQQALQLLSNREAPDYRNSIKESISAVESICKRITGEEKASLGDALSVMEKSHGLHKALKDAFSKLYGYTSDGDGIRHAMLEEPSLEQSDAIYFLVSCSAFVNYLKSKNS